MNIKYILVLLFIICIFIIPVTAINIYPSDELQYSNDTQYSTSSSTNITLSTINIDDNISGGFRVKYRVTGLIYSQINSSNGTNIGDEIYTNVLTFHNYDLNATVSTTDDILVRARANSGTVYVSQYRIYYSNVSYGVPIISSPTNETTYTDVNITWNASSTYVPVYNYQIANDSAFTDLVINGTSNFTTHVFSPPTIGQYYYIRVRQLTDYWDVQSDWSDTVQIYAEDDTLPTAPENTLTEYTVVLDGSTIDYNSTYIMPMDFDASKITNVSIQFPRVSNGPYGKINQTGLISWTRFDNNLTDSSGNDHNGTGTVGYSTVRYNQAVRLNNNSVRIPHHSDYNFTIGDTFSFIMDLNPNNTAGAGNRWLLTKADQNVNSGWSNWEVSLAASGANWDILFRFLDDPPAAWNVYTATGMDLVPGTNYTIAMSYTYGNNSSMRMWKNGTLVSGSWTAGNGSDIPYMNEADISIGGILNLTTVDSNATGKFDNILIYRRNLTQTDLDAYNSDIPSTEIQTNLDAGNWSNVWNGEASTITIPYINTSGARLNSLIFNTSNTPTSSATIDGVIVYNFNNSNTLTPTSDSNIAIGYFGNALFVKSQLMFNHFMSLTNSTGHLSYEYDDANVYAEAELGYIGSILYTTGFNNTTAQYDNTALAMEHVADIIASCDGPEVSGHMEFFTHFQYLSMLKMQDYTKNSSWNVWNTSLIGLDPQECYGVPQYGNNTLVDSANWIANKALLQATSQYADYLLTGDTDALNWTNNITWKYNRQVQDSGFLGQAESTPTTLYNLFGNTHAQELVGIGYSNTTFNATIAKVINFTRHSLLKDGTVAASSRSVGHIWFDAALVSTAMYQQTPAWYTIADISLVRLSRFQYDENNGTYHVANNYYSPDARVGYYSYSYWNTYNLLTGSYIAHAAELFNPYVGLADASSLYENFNDFDNTVGIFNYSTLLSLQSGNYTVVTIPRYNTMDTSGNGSALLPFRFMVALNNSMNMSLIPNPQNYSITSENGNTSQDTLYFKKSGVKKYFNTSYVTGQLLLPAFMNNTTVSFPTDSSSKVVYETPRFDTNPFTSVQNITQSFEVIGDNVNITLRINYTTGDYDWYSFPLDTVIDDGKQKASIVLDGANITYTKGTEILTVRNATATNGDVVATTTNDRRGCGGYGCWNETALQGNMTGSPFELTFTLKIETTNTFTSILANDLELTIVSVPTNLSNTTGANWINWTWDDGSNYTYAQVWINEALNTTVTNETFNMTYAAHANNISVRGYNVTAGTYSDWANDTVTLANNAPVISNVTATYNKTAGENLYIDAECTDSDLDTCMFSTNRSDLFTDFNTTNGQGNWTTTEGTYSIDFGIDDNYGGINNITTVITISPDISIPPTPIITSMVYGDYWKNITFVAGVENITDTFNVSRNGTWYNGTDTYLNTTTTSGQWINDTIYAWNNSGGGTLGDGISNNTQMNSPDVLFEYWDGSTWVEDEALYYLWFDCFWYTEIRYPDGVCQNADQSQAQATLRVTNNGTGRGGASLYLNATPPSNVTIFIDDDNAYAGSTEMTNITQGIGTSLEAGENITMWAWINLTYAAGWEFELYAEVL